MFLCTYVFEYMPHVYGYPWLPEVGVRSPSFQALHTFKNRQLKWSDQNGPSKFQGGKENESKVIRICCLPLQEGNGCHLGGDFICCLINSPCSLIGECRAFRYNWKREQMVLCIYLLPTVIFSLISLNTVPII